MSIVRATRGYLSATRNVRPATCNTRAACTRQSFVMSANTAAVDDLHPDGSDVLAHTEASASPIPTEPSLSDYDRDSVTRGQHAIAASEVFRLLRSNIQLQKCILARQKRIMEKVDKLERMCQEHVAICDYSDSEDDGAAATAAAAAVP